MNKKYLITWLLSCLVLVGLNAQESFPVNGSQDERPGLHALTNATLVTGTGSTITEGTLLIAKDKIEYIGKRTTIPKGYVVHDLKGKYVYPSFIDAFGSYGIKQPEKSSSFSWGAPQVFESQKKGAYGWNEAIRSENKTYKTFNKDEKKAEQLQKFGFGAVQTIAQDGIVRGSSALVSLAKTRENKTVLLPESAAHYSFNKGSSRNSYPSSIMGSVALLRQTHYDAEWYAKQDKEFNISLQEFQRLQDLPQIFEVEKLTDYYRVNRLQEEFGINYIVKSNGEEYQRLNFVKAMGSALIVPIDFPKNPEIDHPLDANSIDLAQLKHWELAPSNPARLQSAGIEFAITAAGIEKAEDFWKNLRKSVTYGLKEEEALKALTLTPAKMLGVEDKLGSLASNKIANFLVVDRPLFEENAQIVENWVQGHKYVLNADHVNLSGSYVAGKDKLEIKGSPSKYTATINGENAVVKQEGYLIGISPSSSSTVSIEAYIASQNPLTLQGYQLNSKGEREEWQAKINTAANGQSTGSRTVMPNDLGEVSFPFNGYGYQKKPDATPVLFKNVTAWTNEEDGVVSTTDILIQDGKIKGIGNNLKAPNNATVIDGTGKHLTPGIIDEHSHLALEAWNESAQAVSSEVRMLDAIDPDDIDIYRQLAGGVTASHLLHGSANPIGGQSQLIKMRWGETQDGLIFSDQHHSIKFALGENVKQSSRPSAGTRFPQTRMGVEQVFTDAFTRAQAYKKAKATNKSIRRDLELEALVEILDEKRDITCHSYVQSEINMLIDLSDRMNFKINTFTHGLETYKLADKLAERGISVGTFADWWAYKYEVIEATPYNAHLLNKQDVLVAINSDDQEMGRRLNQEAAKIVKYGGTSEEEAFKMVTLNPAKILHVDDRVGSLKVGKDADVVLWSDHPLSIYAVAEQTYVDGIKYWDIEENEQKQKEIAQERARLIKKSLKAGSEGKKN